jgi:hypothetical protein
MKRLFARGFSAHRVSSSKLFILCALAVFTTTVKPSLSQDSTHSSGWVVIPVAEYGALHARAFPVNRSAEPPAPDPMLTRVEYELQVRGELASGSATLLVDVLKDGWVRVPIPSGLLVRDAQLDGKPLSLVEGEGAKRNQLYAILSKRGRAVIRMDVGFTVASAAGQERLTLPSGASGVTRATVSLPRQDLDMKVSGGLLAGRMDAGSESKWLAYGRGSAPLAFTWKRKTEDHHVTLPLRLRGSLTQLLGLGEDATSIYAEVNLEVLQGAAGQVKVCVPAGIAINQVLGATVADWEIQAAELTVTFLEPVEHTTRFVIAGETRLARAGAIDIPLLSLLAVERESGGVAVEVLGAGEIRDIKPQGLEAVEAGDLGPMVSSRQSPSLAAFRVRPGAGMTRALRLNVARYAQQEVLTANIEEARYRALLTGDGKALIQARYAVRNNQRNFVKIALPKGATVWSASLAGRPVKPGQAPDGSLLFPLAKARAGEEAPPFAIEILYLSRTAAWEDNGADKGRAALALPLLDLPVSRTGVALYYPPTFRVTSEAGPFRTQPFEEPSSAALAGEDSVVSTEVTSSKPAAQPDVLQQFNSNAAQAGTQALVDKFRARSEARKPAAPAAIQVPFPAVGPSLYLVSELTAENQGPAVDLSYQKIKKGGVK